MASSISPEPISVLFVCLGNICRSTMAEGVFKSLVSQLSNKNSIRVIDSCGTEGYHVGCSPDSRTMSTLRNNGILDYQHAARKIRSSDFEKFDYIFAMDRSNLENLQALQKKAGGKARLMLFGEFAGKGSPEEIIDPYYGELDGFEEAFEQCMRFSKKFLFETLAHDKV
ncbi:Bgt-4626 [Blumeria graminis f. sp. tritici]|uniref:Bgt-4626 n=3 Tax=Blumeria graminis TaxID=34373 RepID=A0A061HKC7_BLUGR|nr:Protein phosphotyrosine phosphatase [Blumeria graminis f. sp. tritici 96224]VCU40888.1 Bgt-4626 [Blumeria graminis f. sp. tritici]